MASNHTDGPWIETVELDGEGGLAHILAIQSLHPDGLAAHRTHYRAIMFGKSPLSRVERESIAVVVSAVNDCFY
jgi:alkylhydroperoxidase family enzyme